MEKGKVVLFLLLAALLCLNRVTAVPVWAPVQQKVVVIDPGHGGWDPGKVGQTAKEKDVNLEIAKILKLYLETADVEVQLTREEDLALGEKKREDLGARRSLAERADVFISIHQNAFPSSGVSGAQEGEAPEGQLDVYRFGFRPGGAQGELGGDVCAHGGTVLSLA